MSAKETPRSPFLDAAVMRLRVSSNAVASTTAQLLSGASALGRAFIVDTGTAVKCFAGSLYDFNQARVYSETEKFLDGVFNKLESLTGKSLHHKIDAISTFYSRGIGATPMELKTQMLAVASIGAAARIIENTSIIPVSDMASHLPNIYFDPSSVVVGALAVAVLATYSVFITRGMRSASEFESDREKAKLSIDTMTLALNTDINKDLGEHHRAIDKFNSKFSESKKFSPLTIAAMISMQAAGASPDLIDIRISDSPSESRSAKMVYASLVDNYRFPAPKAAKVAHDLIINHGGDIPLLQNRLVSRELPENWITDYGFNPKSVVLAEKEMSRPSELRALYGGTQSTARDMLTKIEQACAEKPQVLTKSSSPKP